MRENSTEVLSAALQYAALQWLVLPVHNPFALGGCSCGRQDCEPKRPMIRNWPKAATTDVSQIERWWSAWPNANVGIVTGVRSGLLVLDIDKDSNGDASVVALELAHGKLPATAEAKTGGGGRHLVFSYDPAAHQVRNSQGRLGKGLDIRADSGMILVQPSLHPSGDQYRWIERPGLLAPSPDWLLNLAKGTSRKSSRIGSDLVLFEGQRNAGLTRLAGGCRRIGLSARSISEVLIIENLVRCRPPLGEAEVLKIARQAAKWKRPPTWLQDPVAFVADGRLLTTDRIVLLVLIRHADPSGRCRPGIRRMAAITGLGLNTVVAATKRLEVHGRIEAHRSSRGNRYRLLSYDINSEELANKPRSGSSVATDVTAPGSEDR